MEQNKIEEQQQVYICIGFTCLFALYFVMLNNIPDILRVHGTYIQKLLYFMLPFVKRLYIIDIDNLEH